MILKGTLAAFLDFLLGRVNPTFAQEEEGKFEATVLGEDVVFTENMEKSAIALLAQPLASLDSCPLSTASGSAC